VAEEHSFIYGFRVGHCAKAIAIFLSACVLPIWRMVDASSTFTRVVCGAIAAFFLSLTYMMVKWLVYRRQGRKKIVVGAKALSAPSAMMFSAPLIEIPYAKMRSATTSAGKQGRLLIDSELGPLEIGRAMLGTDAEFDKLTTLVQQRIARAR
jgi:hypothetical protein